MHILGIPGGAKLVSGGPKACFRSTEGGPRSSRGSPDAFQFIFGAYWILKVTPEISGFAWILEMFQSNSTIELPLPKPSWLYLMVH